MISRIGTDVDGWPVYGDQFGRSVREIAEHDDALIEQAYRLTNQTLMRHMPYLTIRQVGVDADGFPVYARPW